MALHSVFAIQGTTKWTLRAFTHCVATTVKRLHISTTPYSIDKSKVFPRKCVEMLKYGSFGRSTKGYNSEKAPECTRQGSKWGFRRLRKVCFWLSLQSAYENDLEPGAKNSPAEKYLSSLCKFLLQTQSSSPAHICQQCSLNAHRSISQGSFPTLHKPPSSSTFFPLPQTLSN